MKLSEKAEYFALRMVKGRSDRKILETFFHLLIVKIRFLTKNSWVHPEMRARMNIESPKTMLVPGKSKTFKLK